MSKEAVILDTGQVIIKADVFKCHVVLTIDSEWVSVSIYKNMSKDEIAVVIDNLTKIQEELE